MGTVGGTRVRCLSAEMQVRTHTGYALEESDMNDLRLLHDRFGIDYPDGVSRGSVGIPPLALRGTHGGARHGRERTTPRSLEAPRDDLRRVVPVAQKRHASGLTVALSFLEIHEGGNGFVRFLMCQERPTRRRVLTSPGLEIRVRDGSGRPLETREDSSGSSMGSSYATLASQATLLIFGLPDSGDVEVEVVRIVELDMFGYPREEGPTWEGPWTFRFRV